MGRVYSAEGIKKLSAFQLQAIGQPGRLKKRFFELDLGLVVVVELEDDVGKAFEIRIDRAVERDLGVARVKSALLWIVVADFKPIEMALARCGQGEDRIERDVHVVLVVAASENGERLGQRGARVRIRDRRWRGGHRVVGGWERCLRAVGIDRWSRGYDRCVGDGKQRRRAG